jgi:hypothetical protein
VAAIYPQAHGTITQSVLASMRVARVVEYRAHGNVKALSIGWPAEDAAAKAAPVQKARDLFGVFEAYFQAEFPMFEETNCFSAFNMSQQLSLSHRRELLETLAIRRGMNPAAVWAGIGGATYPVSGLLARAEWHASSQGKLLQSLEEPSVAFRDPVAPNCLAWLRTLRELRRRDVKERTEAVALVEVYIVFLLRTTNVERWLGAVAMIELKHRAHKLQIFRLGDALKLTVQDLRGRRAPGDRLDANALLVDMSSVAVVWRATGYCVRAQNCYREFYGERTLACRSLASMSLEKQRASALQVSKPSLGNVKARATDSRSYDARLHAHSAGVKRAIAAHCDSQNAAGSPSSDGATAGSAGQATHSAHTQALRHKKCFLIYYEQFIGGVLLYLTLCWWYAACLTLELAHHIGSS